MKLAKLSLATIAVIGFTTSLCAADSLADAFKKGSINGELRAWYFDRDRDATGESADIINTGVRLTYITDDFYGFKFGTTLQSNFAPFADDDAKEVFADDMWGSGAQLSEAYILYKIKNTSVKVGRQFIKLPLIGSSTSRMITQSFEGALLTNTDIPDTTITAGVITKFQARTDGDGHVADFEALNNDHDYAYTVFLLNKSIPGLELTFQYLSVDDDSEGSSLANRTKGYKDYYFEAEYQRKSGNFEYGLAGNYLYTDWENYDAAYMYGVKLSLGYGDLKTYIAYSSINDDDGNKGVKPGEGGGAQPNYVKGKQVKVGTYSSDTSGFSIDANYNFKQIGLLLGARYTQLDIASKASHLNDQKITDLYGSYKFMGALKGLETELIYTILSDEFAPADKGDELWFKAAYKF